ncbi:hypothetical protein FGKAn22_03340 [Ferrigenium kumadai]|uniref:Uncharacterized protein n=1 Tax=Ferrigenium kumadai TaxID=1682490 RepID=A0AAN1SXY6_9PROT|nr:hypothetical protein FGKAn22_03340 [Ferrigenium kumadai]
MQLAAGIGAQADDVAGVGRDFRLIQNDVEHEKVPVKACQYKKKGLTSPAVMAFVAVKPLREELWRVRKKFA